MCVAVFNINNESRYPFIFVGNRDEFHLRPSQAIHQWKDNTNIYGGRDLKEKGTWLGITKQGKFSTILNNPLPFSEMAEYTKSRGNIVKDYLFNSLETRKQYQYLEENRSFFKGYHLIFGDVTALNYYTNVNNEIDIMNQGMFAYSNTEDDLSNYRVKRSKEILTDLLKHDQNINPWEIIDLFHDTRPNPDLENIPDWISYEEAINRSSLFIQDREFGTVNTSLIMVDYQQNVYFFERRYDALDNIEENTLNFKIIH